MADCAAGSPSDGRLLEKVHNTGGWNPPVPAVAAASASLNDLKLVPERRCINGAIRRSV
jgi:hypothetical protein